MQEVYGKLKQKVLEIVCRSAQINSFVKHHADLDNEEIQQIAYGCAELALLALCASDDASLFQEVTNPLLKTEISSRLREIAMHCMDVQEWEPAAMIQSHLEAVDLASSWLRTALDLPLPDPLEQDAAAGEPLEIGHAPALTDMADLPGRAEALVALTEESEEERVSRLRAEIAALRELLTSLIMERDHLLNVEQRELETDYMIKLGKLEAEVYSAESSMRLLQRKLELMQAQRNRRQPIRTEEINAQIESLQEQFRRILEDLFRKAAEAEQYRREQEKKRAEKEYKKAKKKAQAGEEEQRKADNGSADDPKSASGEQAAPDPEATEDKPQDEDDEERLLKKLYRKIVKAMHPDLHPDQDEATRDLFKRAILAYKESDLRRLQEIAAMLDGGEPEPGERLLEALEREREHLFSLIFGIRAELREIMAKHPFNKKELLNSPERLAAEQEKLRKRKDAAVQRAAGYSRRIQEMEAEDGRTDHS